MVKALIPLCFITQTLFSQPSYTPIRAAFTMEGMGIAPVFMFSADVPLMYNSKSFLNGQAGLGISGRWLYYVRPTFSTALTHNFLLNPFHKNLCNPAPDYNRFEYYVEAGLGLSVFDPISGAALPDRLYKYQYLNPSAILGLRIHLIRKKWVHIFRFRFTPFLGRKFEPWFGFGVGLGWR